MYDWSSYLVNDLYEESKDSVRHVIDKRSRACFDDDVRHVINKRSRACFDDESMNRHYYNLTTYVS